MANVIMDRKIGPSVKLIAVFFIRGIIRARLGKFKNVPCKNFLVERLHFLKIEKESCLREDVYGYWGKEGSTY